MSDTVVKVENLGKKYIIGHQQEERYTALRDVIANKVKSLGSFIQNPFIVEDKSQVQNYTEEFWALKDVSFEIKQGDRVGIIGRNGAGKSTLLKILSRITEPTSGRISIEGRVASLLEVGTGFHPELTGRENIYLNGAILGMGKEEIKRKFDEIVAFAEVEKFLDTPVKRYSSGMYVRLAFAVAAHLEPEVLIIDEVLAVGDAKFQNKCLGKMKEVSQEGRTLIFVSHNMGAVSNLCNRAVFLEKGSLRKIGSVEGVINTYLAEVLENNVNDLSRLRFPGMGKEVFFSLIELSPNNHSNLIFSEPIKYEINICAKRDTRDIILGLSIFNSTGTCIGSLLTDEAFSIKADEQVKVYLTLMNTSLAPGSYYTSFGLAQRGSQISLDAVIGKPAFQILPISTNEDFSIANWKSDWGNIVFKEFQLRIGG